MSLIAAAVSVQYGNKQRDPSEDSRPHLGFLHMARHGHGIGSENLIGWGVFF